MGQTWQYARPFATILRSSINSPQHSGSASLECLWPWDFHGHLSTAIFGPENKSWSTSTNGWPAGGSLASGPSINRSFMILMLIIISWHTFPVRSWLFKVDPACRSLGNSIIILLVVSKGGHATLWRSQGKSQNPQSCHHWTPVKQYCTKMEIHMDTSSYIMFPLFHAGQQHITYTNGKMFDVCYPNKPQVTKVLQLLESEYERNWK